MAKPKLHTKDKLDTLSEEQVKSYRVKLITDSPHTEVNDINSPVRKYFLELELYMDIRFKKTIMDRYKRWMKTYKEDPENNPDLKLITSILDNPKGKENMYYLHIASEMEKVKEFQYILGVKVKIPKKYMQLNKLMVNKINYG